VVAVVELVVLDETTHSLLTEVVEAWVWHHQ
jgi:hypothetical protein